MHKISIEALLEDLKAKKINEQNFHDQLRDTVRKQNKLYADVTIKRMRSRILKDISEAALENVEGEGKVAEAIENLF